MEPNTYNNEKKNPSEFSLKDFILSLISLTRYLRSRWITITIFSIVGVAGGLFYSLYKKPIYAAKMTFSIEGDDQNGISGIAEQFGLDLGSDKSSLFEGDNLIQFFQSRLMVQKTLLSEAVFDNQTELLINRFIDFNNYRYKWRDKPGLRDIKFTAGQQVLSRLQDSVIKVFYKDIVKHSLDLNKPDKKLSIIDLTFTCKDELFAKAFTEKLTTNVINFYTISKTQKSQRNIDILQYQTDSVRKVLNSSLSNVAQTTDNAPNANPLKAILKVPSQTQQVNVEASEAELEELIKNLELTKITMRKETPLIDFIDLPILPLDNDKVSKMGGSIIGFFLGAFIAVLSLSAKRMFKSIMA